MFTSQGGGVVLAGPKIDTAAIEGKINLVVFREIGKFPNMCNLKTLKYWQDAIKAICFAETEFNPCEKYFEKTMGYYSCGLMQLSVEDNSVYDFETKLNNENILEIETNVKCGMHILDKLVKRNRTIIFNDGNYWAVLQPKNKRHQVFLKKFNEYQGRNL